MYVADRDTYNDVFCQEREKNESRSETSPKGDSFFCIADRETLNDKGLCEDCKSLSPGTTDVRGADVSPTASVQQLNDTFRKSILREKRLDGKAVMTKGIQALGNLAHAYIFQRIINHSHFPNGDDPYGEHDFGVIEAIDLPKVYWKIDTYENSDIEYGTDDKINCYRVLVIMLADEY